MVGCSVVNFQRYCRHNDLLEDGDERVKVFADWISGDLQRRRAPMSVAEDYGSGRAGGRNTTILPTLQRITDSSGKRAKKATTKQRLIDKRSIGSARQQGCFVCRKYSPKPSHTSFCCSSCLTPICAVDRTGDQGRPMSCRAEHIGGDMPCRCDGKRKMRFPTKCKVYVR